MSNSNKPTKVYKTYAIAVIEAIWPRYLDYRGESKQKNLISTINLENRETVKFSSYQDKYLGYYKIIPLNILNLTTASSKEGNNFSVSFTANKIIFYAEGQVPERLKILLENEPKISIPLDQYPFLEKIFSGSTKEPEVYITNYSMVSDFINEMDTVSIYVVNAHEKFSLSVTNKNYASFLEVFTGSNPGRLKQIELENLSNETLKKLNDIGISINEKDYLKNLDTQDKKIQYFRKFSLNSLFKTKFKFTNFQFPVSNNDELNKIKSSELENIKEINPDAFINYFGVDIYNNYFGIKDYQKNIKTCIENFYSYSKYKNIMSWSAYETFRLKIRDLLGIPSGLCFNSKMDQKEKNSFTKILDTVLIENFLLIYAPASFEIDSFERIKEVIRVLVNTTKLTGICVDDSCSNTYIAGVNEFLERLNEKIKNIGGQHTFINLPDLNESLKINFSGDGIGLLMRGHITSINRSLRIGESDADISISISGRGFEHPLNRNEIVPDLTSIKFAAMPFSNYSVQISTPIDAVKYVMNSFAPYRVNVKDIDDSSLFSAVITSRGFDIAYSTGSRFLVNQGNVVAPKFDAKFEDLIVFTPIHYVSLDLLNSIQESFNKLAAAQKYLANVNRTLSKSSVMDNIRSIVSKSSMYRVYVDHMGYLRIEFEPVNIVSPFSLNLNPPITEENTFALDHSSSEENVRTFVEVFPSSLGINSPSEAGIASIYGRSVSRSINDAYNSNIYINSNNVDTNKFINFLKQSILIIDKSIINSIVKQSSELGKSIEKELRTLKTFINYQTPENIIDYFKENLKKQTINTTRREPEVTRESKSVQDFCTGKIITKNTDKVQDSTKNSTEQVEVPIPLFNPEVLRYLYVVGDINSTYFSDFFYKENTISPIASFNRNFLDLNNLINSICGKLNSLAQDIFNLPKNSDICYEENIDFFASLMILGNETNLFGNYNNTKTDYGKLVTNFINSISIRSSFSIFSISTNIFKDSSSKGNTDYILNNFAYVLPYTDLNTNVNLTFKNYSPDMFIYGLRTITFEDSFIAMYDAVKNESRLSAKRAEIIRSLNSSPINTAKATVYGDVYYIGFTTLVVNENLPPIKGYINNKILDDINVDTKFLKEDKNLLIYVNEIIETNAFKNLYKKSLPKINGYNPPVSVDYDVIVNYFKDAVNYILEDKNFDNFPTSVYVPLFGVYTKDTLKNEAIKGYLDFFVKEPYYRSPNYADQLSRETNEFADYIKKYGSFINEYRKYLKPQNYLVAQGHIENVETNWSLGNIFTSTIGLNYLFPALYTYVILNGKKIILGYVVLNSPLSEFEVSGQRKEFFTDTDWMNVLRVQKQDYMNFFKNSLGFIKNKAKLIAIETSLVEY
jgi:hypothetical protein